MSRGRPSVFSRYGKSGTLELMRELYPDRTDRQRANILYQSCADRVLSEAATEIPNYKRLEKAGCVMEQIGRMAYQDGYSAESCLIIAQAAADALANGCTAKQVCAYIRHGRITGEW